MAEVGSQTGRRWTFFQFDKATTIASEAVARPCSRKVVGQLKNAKLVYSKPYKAVSLKVGC